MEPFYEIICYSKLNYRILAKIADHIEEVINRPVIEYLEQQKNQPQKQQSLGRKKGKVPYVKVYLSYIIHKKQYLNLKEYDFLIENFLMLTKNRKKDQIIFLSANPLSIVAALHQAYQTIPIIEFEAT